LKKRDKKDILKIQKKLQSGSIIVLLKLKRILLKMLA